MIAFEFHREKKSNAVFWRHICSPYSVDHGLKIEIFNQICDLDNGTSNRTKMLNLRIKKAIHHKCFALNQKWIVYSLLILYAIYWTLMIKNMLLQHTTVSERILLFWNLREKWSYVKLCWYGKIILYIENWINQYFELFFETAGQSLPYPIYAITLPYKSKRK